MREEGGEKETRSEDVQNKYVSTEETQEIKLSRK